MREKEVPEQGLLVLHIVDGEPVVAGRLRPLVRLGRFLAKPFVSAWHHRDLIAVILQRELYERFKGSVAGWIWAVVAPILSLATYTVAFGGAAKLPNNQVASSPFDYSLFIFGGLIAFNFFSEMTYRAPSLLQEYAHYIKQTMFPAEMLPIISTLRAAVYSSIGVALMLAFQLVFGVPHWTMLLVPLWAIPFLGFLIGFTWFLSALGVFTRDVSYFMGTISPLLMFATPVFFSHEILPPPWDLVMYANILTGYIEIVRDLVVWGRLPGLWVCLWTILLSALTFWGGYWFFERNRVNIADVV